MQAQSRLAAAASGGGGSGISGSGGISRLGGGAGEEHEAVVRELTRGHELTARLRAEALRALRGQGQAEATATFILGEVSRAFTVCLSIMASASPSASPPQPDETPPADSAVSPPPPRAAREDNVPRKRLLTASPYDDGYQWRKYGQKKINNTNFPRSYYRCSYHRERRCPAQKHVQQRDGDDVPALHVVVYTHEHTCLQGAPAELPDAATNGGAAAAASPDYFPAGGETPSSLRRLRGVGGGGLQPQFVDHRAAMEERERQVLVSSLARVLQGRQCYDDDDDDDTDVASLGAVHARAPAAAAPVAASSSSSGPVDAAGEELDVMDYDMTDALFWGPFGTDSNSYDGNLTSTRCFDLIN
ncbi:transcription factor WRKY19-like [Oryza glaberrima]|uniref:WRKY domain-containing protein n=2 Tax=Oryza TaxID=4527 RepID=A0A0E0N483_ORYRU|nr:transcription factor WRKY19-like [Oryza glaberrima]